MKSFLSVPALLLLASLGLSAQQITGNIRGTVTDPSGAVVRDAVITARQTETGLTRGTSTDRNGSFVILELPVGHYRLQVAAKGFREYVQDGITLNVNETASISPRLAVGAETEQVEVSADAQLIEPTVTSMGKVVQQRELEDLPLNGRNFSQLGLLQPGVVPLTPGIAEAGGSLRNGQGYAVNGQRPESNNFLIDGANNFNGVDGGFVLKPRWMLSASFASLRIMRMRSSGTRWDPLRIWLRGRARTKYTARCGSSCAMMRWMRTTTSRRRKSL
ncbi:carboxypeptidase-like regulatory domain-containing protein [Occallatibacter savannae]|uniref:carboxypeptidase-like regulatory domain-containing protein n=1 Tax=Occallatibacter savannae TaxID=1002691 RepID=UPI001EF441B9|nr:carboxypeptidase-like regulatory domain-containing protein [Occallatibacter savannae]